jgi:hypothetical protein
MISKMPRMVGRIRNGIQTIVHHKENRAPMPQKRLTIPLARVIHAMAFTRVGFCVFMIFLLYDYYFIYALARDGLQTKKPVMAHRLERSMDIFC